MTIECKASSFFRREKKLVVSAAIRGANFVAHLPSHLNKLDEEVFGEELVHPRKVYSQYHWICLQYT